MTVDVRRVHKEQALVYCNMSALFFQTFFVDKIKWKKKIEKKTEKNQTVA